MSVTVVFLDTYPKTFSKQTNVNKYYDYCYYYIHLTAVFPGQPGLAGTRKINHSRFYWSKRQ